ncbi:MAG: zinc ribbon domain-containing protein [Lachnospiraceae bacterium]|nr:zinc ribbon domain-containing protein [Lachnospiraceae bacterium]
MKCPNCGAEVELLDEVCPYCGAVNKESAAHRAEMKHYKERSKNAKEKACGIISENVALIVSSVVLVLLVIGIVAATYVEKNAFMFSHWAARSESLQKSAEYAGILRQYLDSGDYAAFLAFENAHVIPAYEEGYTEFEKISGMATNYVAAMNSIENVVLFGEGAKHYSVDTDISSCQRSIANFFYTYERALTDMEGDPHYGKLLDMKGKMDVALRIYLGLDEEKREEYLESSEGRQKAYLEEVLALE